MSLMLNQKAEMIILSKETAQKLRQFTTRFCLAPKSELENAKGVFFLRKLRVIQKAYGYFKVVQPYC